MLFSLSSYITCSMQCNFLDLSIPNAIGFVARTLVLKFLARKKYLGRKSKIWKYHVQSLITRVPVENSCCGWCGIHSDLLYNRLAILALCSLFDWRTLVNSEIGYFFPHVTAPCSNDNFHCKAENRCIDARLHCDGTPHCDDKTDEDGCSSTYVSTVWSHFVSYTIRRLKRFDLEHSDKCSSDSLTICDTEMQKTDKTLVHSVAFQSPTLADSLLNNI